MHISKIELENIKSHAASTYTFPRGTIAITGENGAGKTTIIEAIAWALFDLLDYKKEDFVRRGAKKGSVRVTFESGLDEREYIVYRDTGAGYHVTDPRLQTRIADKKEEVYRFLWQHLGLEPGTDLKSLFRQAIGVPQGTFTAIFLEGTTERKIAFDRLLKVEEYRQAAEKLRETSRLLDTRIAEVRENIARAEGELSRSEAIKEEHKGYQEQTKKLAAEIETIAGNLAEKQKRVKELDDLERRVSGLQTALERSRAGKERAELVLKQTEQALARATDAAAKIEKVRPDHERHIETLDLLKELERERGARDRLRIDLAKKDASIINLKSEQRRFDQELKYLQKSREEIERLRSTEAKQHSIEKEINDLKNQIAAARTAEERILSIDRKLVRLREGYSRKNYELTKVEEEENNKPDIRAGSEILKERRDEIKAEGLEHKDKKEIFERQRLELVSLEKQMSDAETRLQKSREEIERLQSTAAARLSIEKEIDDLKNQIAAARTAEERILSIERKLVRLRESYARKSFELKKVEEEENSKPRKRTASEFLKERKEEIEAERLEHDKKRKVFELQRRELASLEEKMSDAETRLRKLADPAAQIRVLEKELTREGDIRERISNVANRIESLENESNLLTKQLDEFKEFDQRWKLLTSERDATVDAHRVFLMNETEAAALDKHKEDVRAASIDLTAKTATAEQGQHDLVSAGVDYDVKTHEREKAELLTDERHAAEMRATVEAAIGRKDQLAAELARFAEIRKSLLTDFKEKERLEAVSQSTTFIRDTLKEAAPIVAKNYIRHVSVEANEMFREITGNPEHTLKWAEDYSIILEDGGYERPFISLSGGEQMTAALSVRLALLKQLSDIRIAFFDEPTINMDNERRENFAMQISNIRHFDQLFVISHDDTFDSYVENMIEIGG